MADLLKKELGVETRLIAGDRGEFTVWVGDEIVSQKNRHGFPVDEQVLEAVRRAI